MIMRKRFCGLLAIVLAGWIAPFTHADWPTRVYAPYMYVGFGDDFKLTTAADASGVKYFTLAFIIAKQEGTGKATQYLNEPSWDGRLAIGENFYKDQIDAIRQRGGDIILSFGGEAGKEIAMLEKDPAKLQAAYQSIIDRYHFIWLDFDIEGRALDDKDANHRRNTAIAGLQQRNPSLRISYTLAADPNGISAESQSLLADAKSQGVKVYSADLMVMYFGKPFIHKGRTEGQLGVDSAKAAYAQIQKIDPAIQIGLCPCLGMNGSKNELFELDDAKTLKAFADQTPWICSLHDWCINEDALRGKKNLPRPTTQTAKEPEPWAFARLFNSFTTSK